MSQYIPFICACGCGTAPGFCKKIRTSDIVYWGPQLPCINAAYNTPLNDIIAKVEELCVAMTSTTTSTSSSSTTTTTSTSTSTSTTTTTTTIANCRFISFNITQNFNNPPAVLIVEDTFGITGFSTQYLGVGQYTVTFSGLPVSFDFSTLVLSNSNTHPVYATVSGNVVGINTFQADGTTPMDEVLANQMSFYIKHCSVLP